MIRILPPVVGVHPASFQGIVQLIDDERSFGVSNPEKGPEKSGGVGGEGIQPFLDIIEAV
jgi:hypothetical protein